MKPETTYCGTCGRAMVSGDKLDDVYLWVDYVPYCSADCAEEGEDA